MFVRRRLGQQFPKGKVFINVQFSNSVYHLNGLSYFVSYFFIISPTFSKGGTFSFLEGFHAIGLKILELICLTICTNIY